ncbi:MAG TPA: hypothetical protein VMS43_09685 [Allosphingosinicella sp.]|nr:hypothetical protein [Allosphingosinicella sp.]
MAGRPIDRPGGISELGGLVLRFIDGGTQWLQWAAANPNARYQFADETALMAGIQSGLHATPLLLLAKTALLVSPVKLMTLAPGDLRTLAEAEAGKEGVKIGARVAQILADHGLVTQSGLAAGAAFLAGLGVADAPVFQGSSFGDRLATLDLANDPVARESGASGLAREAAAFAIERATTPQEFADYYRAYLQCVTVSRTKPAAPEANLARVRSAVETLAPLMFGYLDCPRVDGPAGPSAIGAAIEEWLMMGRRLGFARLSLGVQQVIANSGFCQPGGGDGRAVDAYLGAAQALLRAGPLDEGQLGQDGMSRSFRVSGDGGEAMVGLGADGMIALAGFRPPPKS